MPDAVLGSMRKSKEAERAYMRKYRRDHPARDKKDNLRRAESVLRALGSSSAEKQQRIEAQNHRCAICNQLFEYPEVGKGRVGQFRRACQDHNHESGKVRDVICGRCNLIIGHVKEDVSVLEALIAYLLRHKAGCRAP